MSHLDLGPWLAENGLVPAGPVQTAEAAKVIAEAVSAQTAGNKKSFLTFMVGSFLSTTLGEDAGRQDIDGMSSDSLLQVAAACWRKLGVAGRPGATAKAIVDAKSGIEASALWRQSLEPSPAATPEEPPLIHPGRPTTPNARGAATQAATSSTALPPPAVFGGLALTAPLAQTSPEPTPPGQARTSPPNLDAVVAESVARALATMKLTGPRRKKCGGCGEPASRCICVPDPAVLVAVAAAKAKKEASPPPSKQQRGEDEPSDEEEDEEEDEDLQDTTGEKGFPQGGRVTQKSAQEDSTMEALMSAPWADSGVIWAPRVWQLRLHKFPAQRWEFEQALADLALRAPKGKKVSSALLRQLALDSLLLWSRVAGPTPEDEVLTLGRRNLDEIAAAIFWDEGATREQMATFRAELANTDKPKRYRKAFATRKAKKW